MVCWERGGDRDLYPFGALLGMQVDAQRFTAKWISSRWLSLTWEQRLRGWLSVFLSPVPREQAGESRDALKIVRTESY